jgi:hypothetical protein
MFGQPVPGFGLGGDHAGHLEVTQAVEQIGQHALHVLHVFYKEYANGHAVFSLKR